MNNETQFVTALNGIVDIQRYMVGLKPEQKSIGQRIAQAGDIANVISGNGRVRVDLTPQQIKTAILSTGLVNDPLVPAGTPTLDYGARRTLFLQDLLPTFETANGAIEIPVLSSKTNNAGPTVAGSPEARENVTVGESEYIFTNSFEPVETISHSLPVSKQIFEDSGQLSGFINSEMLYGLSEAIENQLLNGAGTTGELNGLIANAAAYANSSSPNYTNEIDIIRDAIRQVRLASFGPNGIILNEADWFDIEIRKQASANDAYVAGNPRLGGEPSLWGLPVHISNAMTSGSFLVADFNRCGIVFDRQQAMIEVSRHEANSFTTGMLALKASARLALVPTNPMAMVTVSL